MRLCNDVKSWAAARLPLCVIKLGYIVKRTILYSANGIMNEFFIIELNNLGYLSKLPIFHETDNLYFINNTMTVLKKEFSQIM